jgi:hypothetical protein
VPLRWLSQSFFVRAFASGISYGTVLHESNIWGSAMQKLPVIAALKHVFNSTTDNIGVAFHISWPWILILLPMTIAVNTYRTLYGEHNSEGIVSEASLLTWFEFVVSSIAYISIAVSWHRFILLEEITEGWRRLRIDGLMWRYAGNVIGIFLVMFLVGTVFGYLVRYLLSPLGSSAPFISVPVLIVWSLVSIVWSYQLCSKLPAVALGRSDFRLRDAWYATAGNFWQLLGFILFFLLVVLIITLILALVTYLLSLLGLIGLIVSFAIEVATGWLLAILFAMSLSSLYGFFAELREF